MMQRINLDYIGENDAQLTWLRWLVTILGIACVCAVIYWQQLQLEIQANTQIPVSERTFDRADPQQTVIQQQEAEALNQVGVSLHQDWPKLFLSLEQTFTPEVGMIEISPNLERRTVKITAIALNTKHMMRYVQTLSNADFFQTVHIVSNEAHEVGGQMTVRFELEATWKG